MERRDWNLIVIASAKGASFSPVQLQKALFLVGETVPTVRGPNFYVFRPYNYGPFSREIYCDAEELAARGDVKITRKAEQAWPEFQATTRGLEKAKALEQELNESEINYIQRLVAWIRGLSFRELLAYIYKKYPKFAKHSMFKFEQ